MSSTSILGSSLVYDWTIGDPLVVRTLIEIFRLTILTFLCTALLDLVCIGSVKKLRKEQPGLYEKSLGFNFLNHAILAPALFMFILPNFTMRKVGCRLPEHQALIASENKEWSITTGSILFGELGNKGGLGKEGLWCGASKDSLWVRGPLGENGWFSGAFLAVLSIQAIGYWAGHKLMHRREWYWIHRFHHKYNQTVVPTAANAVHPLEYIIAYMLPFFIASILIKAPVPCLYNAAYVVSFCNLLIHTPALHDVSENLPVWIVTPMSHMEHHRLLHAHYAAPTINVDYFVAWAQGKPYKCGRKNRAETGGDLGASYLDDKARFDNVEGGNTAVTAAKKGA